jgi:hypothetical protein
LTELYPDNAHFIYELLQNAEDTQATEVQFKLADSAIEFSHNGVRLFTLQDVDSITSIGNSTKRDDVTSIGKFGIGFKAVFAYTNTPEIHSGDFHFQIHNLVVPETKNVNNLFDKTKTLFVFPFNNPKKQPKLAVQEIEKGLCALGDNTLLFLSHIQRIDYTLSDGSKGSLERIDHDNGRIEIVANHPHDTTKTIVSHRLRFQKDVLISENNIEKECRVAIAYQLEQINSNTANWKIIPVKNGGQVSIYFPAEKETSNLCFHIHAPFASTVARDSVRDCQENNSLRDQISVLVVESLINIRDQGLLNISFLAVLPNKKDNLSKFYEPIRTKIIQAFKKEPLTPTQNGSYAPANSLYQGLVKVTNVISYKDLRTLTKTNFALWVLNSSQNQRENNFLESLGIEDWGLKQLIDIFDPYSNHSEEEILSWIETKSDDWMLNLYALLNDITSSSINRIKNFPIVRINSDKHILAQNAYFAIDQNTPASNINIVKPTVYIRNNNQAPDKNAYAFLEKVGVNQFDTVAIIKLKLKRYQSSESKVDKNHYEDIKQFIRFFKSDSYDGELFRTAKFLLGELDNKLYWQSADEICLDEPFMKTGLSELVHIHHKKKLWSGYAQNLSKSELQNFINFIKNIEDGSWLVTTKVMYKLEIIYLKGQEARNNPLNPYKDIKDSSWTDNGTAKDYSIQHLSKYLSEKTITASRLVWDILTNSENCYKEATFQPNRNYPERKVDSQLIHKLKNFAWIPNKNGEFCKPEFVTRATLHPDFLFNDANGLLTAIEFGKADKAKSAEYEEKNKIARLQGFESSEEMEKARELFKKMKAAGKSPAEIEAFLSPKKADFSKDKVNNPEKRVERIKEIKNPSPEYRTDASERNVVVKREIKNYLKKHYTDEGRLCCQICKESMPFKLDDGNYYFEAIQLIEGIENVFNYIALCPTDAAKFKYANNSKGIVNKNIRELANRIEEEINNSQNKDNSISLNLAGNEEELTFSPVHLLDLKAIFSK